MSVIIRRYGARFQLGSCHVVFQLQDNLSEKSSMAPFYLSLSGVWARADGKCPICKRAIPLPVNPQWSIKPPPTQGKLFLSCCNLLQLPLHISHPCLYFSSPCVFRSSSISFALLAPMKRLYSYNINRFSQCVFCPATASFPHLLINWNLFSSSLTH